MELVLESGRVIPDATEADILTLLEGEDFAILSTTPDTYIQCAEQNEPPYEYMLEYQEGSTDLHFAAAEEKITLEQVTAAFLKYLRGDGTWKNDFRWEKLDL